MYYAKIRAISTRSGLSIHCTCRPSIMAMISVATASLSVSGRICPLSIPARSAAARLAQRRG